MEVEAYRGQVVGGRSQVAEGEDQIAISEGTALPSALKERRWSFLIEQ
jgi:hypothetical protein